MISKTKTYKKFRSNLRDFFLSLAKATHQCDVLYGDIFTEALQGWLVAASSSKLRAFRHTSTALLMIWLEVLCEINQIVLKDFSIVQRQRDAEAKKATRGNDKSRVKDIEKRIKDCHARQVKLEAYLRDIFDAVFIHRYRDAEPAIRIECIRSLGVFMRTLPTYWLEGSYLRYFGWMLTDTVSEIFSRDSEVDNRLSVEQRRAGGVTGIPLASLRWQPIHHVDAALHRAIQGAATGDVDIRA